MIPMLRAVLMIALVVSSASAGELGEREAAAVEASRKWLALVDAGDYQRSWETSSSAFRERVPSEQWQQAAADARKPLGRVVSRELVSATFTESLPGSPEGEYVVVHYRASFEHKADATEKVVPVREDGAWRVSGYLIR